MRTLRLAVATILVIFLSGCGGPSGASGDPDGTALECQSVALSSSSGEPLDLVSVSGVSAPADTLLAAQVAVDGTPAGHAMVAPTSGGLVLHVPAHPNGTLAGGEVTLSFTDGIDSCDPVAFTIEALPSAPGTVAHAVDLLEESISLQAELMGTTLQELESADAGALPPHLLPLFAAHLVLAGDRNPNSVRAVLEGTSPAFEGVPESTLLIDALLAKSGAVSVFQRRAGALREELQTIPASALKTQGLPYDTSPTAELLDRYMRLATFGELASDPDATRFLDVASALLGGAGTLAGAAGPAAKPLTALYAEVGGLLLAYQQATEGLSKLLPSEFTSFTFDVTKDTFNEDDDDLEGAWSNAVVHATSKGWQLDKLILDTLLNWSGQQHMSKDGDLEPLLGGVNTHEWVQTFTSSDVLLEIIEHVDDFFVDIITSEVINATASESGIVTIPPVVFGPTDVGAQEWSERYFLYSGNSIFEFSDRHTYEAKEVGVATLEIITEPGKFGFKQIEQQQVLEAKAIVVNVTPPRMPVTPGDTVTFTVDVQNANDPTVEWSIEPAGVHTLIVGGTHSGTVSVVTSSNPDHLPAVLTAKSTADTGLRADGTPERSGTATLSPNKIVVEPEWVCLQPGDTQQYTAEYPEFVVTSIGSDPGTQQSEADVVWDASNGAITSDGLFTAPSEHGVVTITASDPEEPELTGEATVMVSDCVAVAHITIQGPTLGSLTYALETTDFACFDCPLDYEFYVLPGHADGPMYYLSIGYADGISSIRGDHPRGLTLAITSPPNKGAWSGDGLTNEDRDSVSINYVKSPDFSPPDCCGADQTWLLEVTEVPTDGRRRYIGSFKGTVGVAPDWDTEFQDRVPHDYSGHFQIYVPEEVDLAVP